MVVLLQVKVAGKLAKALKPHQWAGVRFMWKNVVEGVVRACTCPASCLHVNVGLVEQVSAESSILVYCCQLCVL